VNQVWDILWSVFSARVASICHRIAQIRPDVECRTERFATDVFPFRGYAGFSSDFKTREGLVISVDCIKSGDGIRCSVDIAREGREILAELSDVVGSETESFVQEWSKSVDEFIVSNGALIEREFGGGSAET
jgi:hypothetical protein